MVRRPCGKWQTLGMVEHQATGTLETGTLEAGTPEDCRHGVGWRFGIRA
jgi:hypothetical protein